MNATTQETVEKTGKASSRATDMRRKTVAIVGNPNVGKSVLFNRLTGVYVTVSNYPGTTVEVTQGKCSINKQEYLVIDTPGMYSLLSVTEEERVARRILLDTGTDCVIHVVDAKTIDRMLSFSLQLMEAGLPLILVLNMMDEVRKLGIEIDIPVLEKMLRVPVIPVVATTGEGINQLKSVIDQVATGKRHFSGSESLSNWSSLSQLQKIIPLISGNYGISKVSMSLLLIQGDAEIHQIIGREDPNAEVRIKKILTEGIDDRSVPPEYRVALERKQSVDMIVKRVIKNSGGFRQEFASKLSDLTMRPLTGIPILLAVLYFGLYKLVGQFGAGTLVNFLETSVFEKWLNPFATMLVDKIIPWVPIRQLFVGDYGVFTHGLRYAIAIILPIVTIFFLVFSIIEDSGYLPRLAMLIDRLFKTIGLSGRAVIPMVLGLGCDTMATIVTRTLPTVRERVISTVLLSLAIPCSAQLGVILALMQGKPSALVIWLVVIVAVFLFVGFLTAKLMPGKPPLFFMEIPPLRLPKISNILVKTYTRLEWYLKEVIPLFIIASLLIWIGQITGLFALLTHLLVSPVRLIGLPDKAAEIFLFGFFRRDYGAAGLYDLAKAGALDLRQIAVSCVALTLFLPCIAQFLMNIKERGLATGLAISGIVLVFSFAVAFVLNGVLVTIGWPG